MFLSKDTVLSHIDPERLLYQVTARIEEDARERRRDLAEVVLELFLQSMSTQQLLDFANKYDLVIYEDRTLFPKYKGVRQGKSQESDETNEKDTVKSHAFNVSDARNMTVAAKEYSSAPAKALRWVNTYVVPLIEKAAYHRYTTADTGFVIAEIGELAVKILEERGFKVLLRGTTSNADGKMVKMLVDWHDEVSGGTNDNKQA